MKQVTIFKNNDIYMNYVLSEQDVIKLHTRLRNICEELERFVYDTESCDTDTSAVINGYVNLIRTNVTKARDILGITETHTENGDNPTRINSKYSWLYPKDNKEHKFHSLSPDDIEEICLESQGLRDDFENLDGKVAELWEFYEKFAPCDKSETAIIQKKIKDLEENLDGLDTRVNDLEEHNDDAYYTALGNMRVDYDKLEKKFDDLEDKMCIYKNNEDILVSSHNNLLDHMKFADKEINKLKERINLLEPEGRIKNLENKIQSLSIYFKDSDNKEDE